MKNKPSLKKHYLFKITRITIGGVIINFNPNNNPFTSLSKAMGCLNS